ncbi:MAG TPA: bifunctional pyr operon transcriptional regulator/uracil phosphoribosyltransferase PyrR [Tepidisphaeraceae bacterium]|jgi:pyrimidine operon attenuation protein/uracil phosphoribosyltransferase|nr:bifunctional pyr operon transcriptional regulator/uracil phosphoribosyltransferase PyrR [Tepidisphaeraceae bacterium]
MARHDHAEIATMIVGLADSIAAAFDAKSPINVVGIRTRGEVLAQRLVKLLNQRGFANIGRGVLDITLYRDDLSEVGPRPLVRPTRLDITIDAVALLLVDDVLFTGRSVRAALDALSDFGRPSVVRLAVLVDRGGRELPIQPDFVALKMTNVPAGQRVKVRLSEVDGVDEIIVAPK